MMNIEGKEIKKAVIYQIGRIDFNVFNMLEFLVDNKSFETTLSSFAIRKFFQSNDYEADVVLIYPVSLPMNTSLAKNESFFANCPKEFHEQFEYTFKNLDIYLKNPETFLKSHPHSQEIKHFKVIHSIGVYKSANSEISFDSHYSDIVLTLLIEMIKKYLSEQDKIKNFLIDISSGHNIYVSAMIDASRYFGVWLKLYGWEMDMPIIQLAFSDPVIQGLTHEKYKIYFEGLDSRAFFSSPISYADIVDYLIAREIYGNNRILREQLQSVLEGFVIIFSAIKNNTPLVIYQFGYHDENEIIKALEGVLKSTEEKLKGDYKTSPNLNKGAYIKVLLTCAFYLGIVRILKINGVGKIDKEGIDIESIRNSFQAIYKSFGIKLNDVILGNEVNKIMNDVSSGVNEWYPIINLLANDRRVTSPHQRNFFAHAGFEGNVTEYRKFNGKVYLRYKEEHKKTILKWLKKSV